jgi:hypothetical protein
VQLILALAAHLCNTASMETNKTCPVCGEPVPLVSRPQGGGQAKKYCSRKCQSRAWCTANHEKSKDIKQKYNLLNPEKVRAAKLKYCLSNHEKVKESSRSWCKANPEKVRARYASWAKANPEKVRAKQKAWIEKLSDKYVLELITKRTTIKPERIPESFIEAKRAHIQLKRELKEKK